MECSFCAETIKDEAIVCKHCGRDLRRVKPMMFAVQELVADIEGLQRALTRATTTLALREAPLRFVGTRLFAFVVLPTLLLLAAHAVVTFVFDVSPVYLRLASFIIPLPFGIAAVVFAHVGARGGTLVPLATAGLSVAGMLAVVSYFDNVPMLPGSWREWRETLEYVASIALAYGTGIILATIVIHVLPSAFAASGKLNPTAFQVARLLGPHVGDEALRRRARVIQDFMRTGGSLAGLATAAGGSIYTGLKGILLP